MTTRSSAHLLWTAAALCVLSLPRPARCQDESDQLPITGTGATFPGEVFQAWTSSFESVRSTFRNIDMRYTATGSSTGKVAMQDDPDEELNYAGTDSEMTALEYISNPDLHMVPILAGPVVLGFNLPLVETTINLTKEHVVGIFNGTFRFWNESSIQDINPNVTFPQKAIRVVVRADYSGTTEIFTASLSNFDPNWNTTYGKFPDGLNAQDEPVKWNDSVVDLYGKLNRGVSGIILSYRYSIGYLSIADAVVTGLPIVRIYDEVHGVIAPDFLHVRAAMDRSAPYLDSQLTADLNDFVQLDEYPIIGYSYFIIKMTTMPNCDQAVELARYIEWTYTDSFSTEQIIDYRMSSVTESIGLRIENEVLRIMECENGESVWSLVEKQKEQEYLSQQKWRIPVFIAVPLAGLGLIGLIVYIILQQVRLRRALLSDEWKILSDDIKLSWSRKYGLTCDKNGPGSLISLNLSMGSNTSTSAALHVWGIGTWTDKNVCIREVPSHTRILTQNKETKKNLLWMKYKAIHMNVLRFYGATYIDHEVFIVSEHAQKGTLSDVVQNEKYRIDDNIKFSLASDLASGMTYLHGVHIVHGHLHSDCCFIDHRWNVKISDWEFTMIHQTKNNIGKKLSRVLPIIDQIHYEPDDPNIVARRNFFRDPCLLKEDGDKASKMSDVYSFSIVMVEIFTRDDPFSELSALMEPTDVIEAVTTKDVRPKIDDLQPTSIHHIISSAWDRDHLKRPSFAQLKKLLKGAKPSKKSVMDSMMEVLEGYVNQLEEKVSERTAALASANSSLENLLHQILPPSVADSLSRGESVAPESFESVTIFFSDIVGFTSLSSSSTPFEVVNMLNDLYTTFDAIIDNHDVYKVETIGDAYMVISGLPKRNGDQHAAHICTMALDLIAASEKFKIRHRPEQKLTLRAGVHSGSVVSGVVGLKMPRYCLFGDTVNTASRMESTSVAMKIQISQTTYEILQQLGDFKTEPRGEIEVKGKGQMKTYFLLGRDGYVPLAQESDATSGENHGSGLTTRDVGLFQKVKNAEA